MPLLRDVHLPIDYSARLVGENTLRRLFVEEDAGMRGCAAEAECLDDGRRWRITLDDRRIWSDGRPLSAQDAVDALDQAVRGRSNSAALFLSSDPVDGPPIRVVDPATVEYRFDRPVAFAPALLSLPAFAPRRAGAGSPEDEPALGDYKVSDWTPDHITLSCNDFAEPPPGAPDAVRFLHVPTAAETLARYGAGDLDATSPTGFGLAEIAALQGVADAVSTPIDVFGSLDFGRRAPAGWLSSAAARRSLSGLIDRRELEARAAGLVLPWLWPGADALGTGAFRGPVDDRDLDVLRQGLHGRLDIAYSAFDPNAEIAEELARQIGQALGVDVSTRRLSFKEYIRATATRDYCMLYSLTAPAFAHPAGSLSDWRSTGRAAVRSGIADPVFDVRLEAAERCLDPAGAELLWERVADRWCELLPKIPLIRVQAWYLRRQHLRTLNVTVSGLMFFGTRPASDAPPGAQPGAF